MPHRKLTGLPRLAFGVVPTLVLVLGLVRWRIANTPRTHLAGGRVVDVRTKGLNNTYVLDLQLVGDKRRDELLEWNGVKLNI